MQKLKFIAMSLVSALCLAGAADVWEDCAWRLGDVTDANANGIFDNGDLTEYFHAADASHASHQIERTAESEEEGFDHGIEVANTDVMRVTEGVSASQNVVRFRRPVVGDEVYSYKVSTPCQITGDKYTVICRFRMAAFNPAGGICWIFSAGYCWNDWRHPDRPQGGNGLMFGINASGQVVIQCAQRATTFNNTGWQYIPESWYRPIQTNYWVDAAIIADGAHVRVYFSPENNACRWREFDPVIPEGASIVPAEGNMVDIGGESAGKVDWRTSASNGKTKGFCGDIAELAAWNRALSKSEVVEALGKCGPALFRVGTSGRTKDFCGGAATSGMTAISTAMRNPGAVSRTLNAGGRLEIPFTVQSRNDQLPQLFRIVPSGDSASGSVRMAIDGNVIEDISVRAGKMSKVFVEGRFLTTGDHTAVVTCISGPVSWDVVDLCGSFCYDFGVSKYPAQYGRSSQRWGQGMAEAIADAFAGDWGRYDMKYVSTASGYEGNTLIDKRPFRFHWTPGDLNRENFTFKVQYGTYNDTRGNEVPWQLLWNGSEVSASATRHGTAFEMELDGSNLIDGDNVFGMDTDTVIDTSGNAGVYINYVAVTVKKPKVFGFSIFVR